MRGLVVFAFIFCAVAFESGSVVCGLCKSLIGTLGNLDGHRVKEYIDSLCAKASGFVATICIKITEFGIDKLIELLHEKVEPEVVCSKIKLC